MRSRVVHNFGRHHRPVPDSHRFRHVPRTAVRCDCNGSGAVTINQLILGVNVALGVAPLSA